MAALHPSDVRPEVWLRGPLPDIPPLLQPVAHALLQAVEVYSEDVTPLWTPAPERFREELDLLFQLAELNAKVNHAAAR